MAVLCLISFLPVICLAAEGEYELRDGKWVLHAAPQAGTVEGEAARIAALVDSGKNKAAVSAAKKFSKQYPDSPFREEVFFHAGEAELARGRYFQAFEWFEKQIAAYPSGRLLERALDREFKCAEAFLAGKKRVAAGIFRLPATDDGLDILMKIAEHAPGSNIAERALMRIADFYYSRRQYPEAVKAYDQYLSFFGKTERAPYATIQTANASLASYRGVRFDETPLLDAEHRYAIFAERYPELADQQRIDETLNDIANLKAEKVLATGRYYQRAGRNDAAEYYYQLTAMTFPQTPAGADAKYATEDVGTVSPLPTAEDKSAGFEPFAEDVPSLQAVEEQVEENIDESEESPGDIIEDDIPVQLEDMVPSEDGGEEEK